MLTICLGCTAAVAVVVVVAAVATAEEHACRPLNLLVRVCSFCVDVVLLLVLVQVRVVSWCVSSDHHLELPC